MSAENDFYYTVTKTTRSEEKVLGSRFIGYLIPVSSEETVGEALHQLKKEWYDATHHCYAWRLRTEESGLVTERSSDDGEPSGTAGKPILQILQSSDLQNVLGVVVRYFGGTKLGTGGLVRAYSGAMKTTMESVEISKVYLYKRKCINADFGLVSELIRFFGHHQIKIFDTVYSETVCFHIGILPSKLADAASGLENHFRGKLTFE